MTAIPPPASAQPPKGKSPLVKILIFFGVFFGAICLALAVAVYQWWSNPDTQKKVSAAKDVMNASMKATKAPGTEALRRLGCLQAMAYQPEDLGALAEVGGAEKEERDSLPNDAMVTCIARSKTKLTCEQVATAYAQSAKPTKPFILMLQFMDLPAEERVQCTSRFEPDGTFREGLSNGYRRETGAPRGPSVP